MDGENVIYIVIGFDKTARRFNEFYERSLFLAKNGLLTRVSKPSLVLCTKHFNIRFIPNTKIDLLQGLRCDWAYGFTPDFTRYLEFKTSETMRIIKPLVENTDELFKYIVEKEDDWVDQE